MFDIHREAFGFYLRVIYKFLRDYFAMYLCLFLM